MVGEIVPFVGLETGEPVLALGIFDPFVGLERGGSVLALGVRMIPIWRVPPGVHPRRFWE